MLCKDLFPGYHVAGDLVSGHSPGVWNLERGCQRAVGQGKCLGRVKGTLLFPLLFKPPTVWLTRMVQGPFIIVLRWTEPVLQPQNIKGPTLTLTFLFLVSVYVRLPTCQPLTRAEFPHIAKINKCL